MAERAGIIAGAHKKVPGLAVVALCLAASGCAMPGKIDDPCAMANRDVSFGVLMENSISNVYNMCLERMRQQVVAEWGEQ